MYCIPVFAQRRREFYSTGTSRFFTYRGGVWNAISEGTLYIDQTGISLCFVTIVEKTLRTIKNFGRNFLLPAADQKSLREAALKSSQNNVERNTKVYCHVTIVHSSHVFIFDRMNLNVISQYVTVYYHSCQP